MTDVRTGPVAADAPKGLTGRAKILRLWALALLLALAVVAAQRFIAIAQDPRFQVHSDDLTWVRRFVEVPRAALPTRDTDYRKERFLPGPGQAPKEDLDYIYGLDQPALERWVFRALLSVSGRLPGSLPEKNWDYTKSAQWNIDQGNIAPPETVRFVRAVNAAFMIGAVILIFIAIARGVTPLAAFVAGLYLAIHPSMIPAMWSIGPDPLLWLLMAAALAFWVWLGESPWAAVFVGIAGGLAASAKLNGAIVPLSYCLWLILKRKPLHAVLSGAIALAAFILTNPIVFSRGVPGVPAMLWEIVRWRGVRTAMMRLDYPEYAAAPAWHIPFYLLGAWWALVPLVFASRKLWRLDPAVFWAAAVLAVHLVVVTVPAPRYTLPIEAGVVLGLIAAYWPRRSALPWRKVAGVFRMAKPAP